MTAITEAYRVPSAVELPDDLDPQTRRIAEENEKRWQAVTGLRLLAQLLDDHPELPVPYSIVAQAGPTGGEWGAQRAAVTDAAAKLGLPLCTDNDENVTVRAELTGWPGPYVAYVVHAAVDGDSDA